MLFEEGTLAGYRPAKPVQRPFPQFNYHMLHTLGVCIFLLLHPQALQQVEYPWSARSAMIQVGYMYTT